MSGAAVSVLWVTSAPVRTLRSGAVRPRAGAAPRPSASSTGRREPLLRLLVGATFRRRREAQGRTLADVAAQARVSIAYLSEIERGRKEPSSEVLVAVCTALGMRLADLLVEAADELRAADLRPARQAVATRGAVDVRSVAERSDPDDDTRRALLSVA